MPTWVLVVKGPKGFEVQMDLKIVAQLFALSNKMPLHRIKARHHHFPINISYIITLSFALHVDYILNHAGKIFTPMLRIFIGKKFLLISPNNFLAVPKFYDKIPSSLYLVPLSLPLLPHLYLATP
jgi:hypothetical protein